MTRDYARPNRPRPRPKNSRIKPSRNSAPGWVWMVAGILIGAVATSIFRPPVGTPQPPPEVSESAPANAADSPADDSGHKPRFDFYTLLKETEVIVPEQEGVAPPKTLEITPDPEKVATDEPEIAVSEPEDTPDKASASPAAAAAPSTATATPAPVADTRQPQEQTVYVLQAGSFKQANDADSVRARLLLLNLQASIEKVTTNNNETWHRVLIGPFQTQAESSQVRNVLSQNGIDSIQLKRRL